MQYTPTQQFSQSVQAMRNCKQTSNEEWCAKHAQVITELCSAFMPCGSGFDCGTELDFDLSYGDKLVFITSFHHMSEHGYYDGWMEYTVTVRPAFRGFRIAVSGRNRNNIKDHIRELFDEALGQLLTDEKRNRVHEVAFLCPI